MLSVYNTLSRRLEPFVPADPENVRMYVCGMTVYDYCHLGHARVMMVFDMIARFLRASGFGLTYVRNITDIDDKIIARAAQNGESVSTLTERFIAAMHEDAARLNVLPPDAEPRATAYIDRMQSMIQALIDRGMAYVGGNGDVYCSVREFPAYGQLSGKSPDDLRAGERVGVDRNKRDPLDFVLWKSAKKGEPFWSSPWGDGRPGWHIECSAMSDDLLGERFDIHGGGADLQFPHHENEIVQSCGAHGFVSAAPCSHVKYWLHNGFVRVDNEKMSKSLGNFSTIREVLKRHLPETVRFFMLRTHYRSPLNYSDEHLRDARNALNRLYTALAGTPPGDCDEVCDDYRRRFFAAMEHDFDTPKATALLFELAGECNKTHDPRLSGCLKSLGAILGLLRDDPEEFLRRGPEAEDGQGLDEAQIEELIARRNEARAAKNWAESDRIRDLLLASGIVPEDKNGGSSWRRR